MNNSIRSMSRIIQIYYNKSGQIDLAHLDVACKILNEGGVIAVPTDTLYGLAAKIDDNNALEKIYKIKERDRGKPLAVCLGDVSEIRNVANTETMDNHVLTSLLPGPLTVLLNRKPDLNPNLNPGIETVGVRVPDHNFIKAICLVVGPLALTSANRSGETSPLKIEEFQDIWNEVNCVFDSGELRSLKHVGEIDVKRLGSTVVDLSKSKSYKIVREGCSLNRTVNILRRFGFKKR